MQNRLEKNARIFSRRHKQTTFSDAGFLGVLRVKRGNLFLNSFFLEEVPIQMGIGVKESKQYEQVSCFPCQNCGDL